MRRLMLSLLVLFAPMYSIGSVETAPAPHPFGLDQETITAEGGGTLIQASERVLVDGLTPDGKARWRLFTYRTTEWECSDVQFLTLAGDIRGANGGCGGPDPHNGRLDIGSQGGVHGEEAGQFYSDTFDLGLPAGTTSVRVTLSDGTTLFAEARNDAFAAVWLGHASAVAADALAADGGVLQHALPPR